MRDIINDNDVIDETKDSDATDRLNAPNNSKDTYNDDINNAAEPRVHWGVDTNITRVGEDVTNEIPETNGGIPRVREYPTHPTHK